LPQRLNQGFFTIIPAGILTIASISKFCNNDLLQQHGTEEEDKASHNPDMLTFSGTGISDERVINIAYTEWFSTLPSSQV
jgi:hypothetical protein